MRAMMGPVYRALEHASGYALAQVLAKPTTDRFRELIRRHIVPKPDDKLLDVGCGTGNYRSSFACDYVGVDINPDYIEKANAHLAREHIQGRFMVMDCTRLQFDSATFDHVITIATTHHLNDDELVALVREAMRVCKPSGRVHVLDAILPVTPNFTFKRIWFGLDRGRHPREYGRWTDIIARAGQIGARDMIAGPMHDVAYAGLTPPAG